MSIGQIACLCTRWIWVYKFSDISFLSSRFFSSSHRRRFLHQPNQQLTSVRLEIVVLFFSLLRPSSVACLASGINRHFSHFSDLKMDAYMCVCVWCVCVCVCSVVLLHRQKKGREREKCVWDILFLYSIAQTLEKISNRHSPDILS